MTREYNDLVNEVTEKMQAFCEEIKANENFDWDNTTVDERNNEVHRHSEEVGKFSKWQMSLREPCGDLVVNDSVSELWSMVGPIITIEQAKTEALACQLQYLIDVIYGKAESKYSDKEIEELRGWDRVFKYKNMLEQWGPDRKLYNRLVNDIEYRNKALEPMRGYFRVVIGAYNRLKDKYENSCKVFESMVLNGLCVYDLTDSFGLKGIGNLRAEAQ